MSSFLIPRQQTDKSKAEEGKAPFEDRAQSQGSKQKPSYKNQGTQIDYHETEMLCERAKV